MLLPSAHPVLNAFADSCLYLKSGGFEDTLAQIASYAAGNDESRLIFAYGYDEDILNDKEPEQTRACLDEISRDRPVVILGKSGNHCWFNSLALETVKAAAAEDGIPTVSLQYLLSVLEPFDFDIMPERLPADMGKYCERGFTSVFDCGAPDFFASVYQSILVNIFQENMIKQRFYGSLLVNCDVSPVPVIRRLAQYRTNCVELDKLVNFNTLKLVVDRTSDKPPLSNETMRELCMEAGDKGFDIHIDAIGKNAVFEAIEALEAVRAAGYKKSSFTIAHGETFAPEELADTNFRQDIRESPGTLGKQALDMLTIDAAIQLGVNNEYGSIEKGKHADFAIFNENPLDADDLSVFRSLKAVMTVIEGQIVYDAENDDRAQWHSILTSPQD